MFGCMIYNDECLLFDETTGFFFVGQMLRVAPPDTAALPGHGYKMAAQDHNMNGYPSHLLPGGSVYYGNRINPFSHQAHLQLTVNHYAQSRSQFSNSDGVYAEIQPLSPKSPLHSQYGNTDTWLNPAFSSPIHGSQRNTSSPKDGPIYASPTHVQRPSPAHSLTVSSPAHSASSSNSSNAAVNFFTR